MTFPIYEFPLTVELYTFLFGGLIAILFAWVPFVNNWYASLSEEWRKAFMLGFSIVLTVALGLSSCWDWYKFVICGKEGYLHLAMTWAAFLLGNLFVDKLVPKSQQIQALLKK